MANIRVWSFIICRMFFIGVLLMPKTVITPILKTSLGLKVGRKIKHSLGFEFES